jgi:hypothetical protein
MLSELAPMLSHKGSYQSLRSKSGCARESNSNFRQSLFSSSSETIPNSPDHIGVSQNLVDTPDLHGIYLIFVTLEDA